MVLGNQVDEPFVRGSWEEYQRFKHQATRIASARNDDLSILGQNVNVPPQYLILLGGR